MGIVTSWMISQGLGLGKQYAEAYLREIFDIESYEAAMSEKLEIIDRKLDMLINGPFKEALMHLRQGNLKECQGKVIEAKSLNELNLAASLLHCILLQREGNYALALEYYEEIASKFGPHKDILPVPLVRALSDYATQFGPLRTIKGFELDIPISSLPVRIFCSLSYLVVWVCRVDNAFNWLAGDKGSIIVLDWTGNVRLTLEARNLSILVVTTEYVVFCRKNQKPQVLRLKDGSEVGTLTQEQVKALFYFNSDSPGNLTLDVGHSAEFAGASIRIEDCTRRQTHIYHPHRGASYPVMSEDHFRKIVAQGDRPYTPEPIREVQAVYIFSKDGKSKVADPAFFLEEPRHRVQQVDLDEHLGGQAVVVIIGSHARQTYNRFRVWLQYETRLVIRDRGVHLFLYGLDGHKSLWQEIAEGTRMETLRFEVPMFKKEERTKFPRVSGEQIVKAAAATAGPAWGQTAMRLMDSRKNVTEAFISCVRISILIDDQEVLLLQMHSSKQE